MIVPALGTENAKLSNGPATVPVRSTDVPRALSVGPELPKPIKPPVPATPLAKEVSDTGTPDANGIIVPTFAGPVGPVGPVIP
ncbi:hypothetical protein NCCP2222_32610 [Sporosarcina sp. NCCP-2222]|nr:hypothetical protein NCCP2222_32610 [Sporosarcina sp. NCCP-2222]